MSFLRLTWLGKTKTFFLFFFHLHIYPNCSGPIVFLTSTRQELSHRLHQQPSYHFQSNHHLFFGLSLPLFSSTFVSRAVHTAFDFPVLVTRPLNRLGLFSLKADAKAGSAKNISLIGV